MELNISKLLHQSAPILIFFTLLLGCLVGRIKIGSFRISSTAGVMIVGLIFGHLGYSSTLGLDTIGFILFIYCIGLKTGPQFVGIFLEDGLKYIILAAVVACSALIVTKFISHIENLSAPLAAGIMAGSLSSTPVLIGAQDSVRSLYSDDLLQVQTALSEISVGFALTYIIGTFCLLLVVNYSSKLLGINLQEESKKVEALQGLQKNKKKRTELLIVRAYRIDEDCISQFEGKTLRQLALYEKTGCIIDKVRRGGTIFEPNGDTMLVEGDSVALVGRTREIYKFPYKLNQELFDKELLDYEFVSYEIVVIDKNTSGRKLSELEIDSSYGCFVSKVTRSQIEMPINDDLVIARGDVLEVSGEKGRLERLSERIGYVDQNSYVTDMFTFSMGIVLGLMLGHLVINLGGVNLALGNASGLLISGIAIGHWRNNHPTFGRVPRAATYILTELGLMLFMGSVGLKAGGKIVDSFITLGPLAIYAGLSIMIFPILIGYLVGRFVLKLNIAILLGALTGARTSTLALNLLIEESKSNVPALSYAGTYTFANIFLTLAGTIIINLF